MLYLSYKYRNLKCDLRALLLFCLPGVRLWHLQLSFWSSFCLLSLVLLDCCTPVIETYDADKSDVFDKLFVKKCDKITIHWHCNGPSRYIQPDMDIILTLTISHPRQVKTKEADVAQWLSNEQLTRKIKRAAGNQTEV